MRAPFTIVLVVALFTGCERKEGGLVRDESDKPDYAVYWKEELARSPSPKIVIQQADAYFDSLPFAQRSPHRNKIRAEFSRGFFSGFTNPTGEIVGGEHDTGWHGFKAGQKYRRSQPNAYQETMEGFGYTLTEVEGTWKVGFEQSDFRPRGGQERWWLWAAPGSAPDIPKDIKILSQGVLIRVHGFLSPKGQYGHLGMYPREFYADRITLGGGK